MDEQERRAYARQVLQTARETLARTECSLQDGRVVNSTAVNPLKRRDIQADIDSITVRDFRYRVREPVLESEPVPEPVRREPEPTWDDWNKWCDNRIRSIVQQHQKGIIDGIAQVLVIERRKARKAAEKAMANVSKDLQKAREELCSQFREFLTIERRKTSDALKQALGKMEREWNVEISRFQQELTVLHDMNKDLREMQTDLREELIKEMAKGAVDMRAYVDGVRSTTLITRS
jgi:hypothetical protein